MGMPLILELVGWVGFLVGALFNVFIIAVWLAALARDIFGDEENVWEKVFAEEITRTFTMIGVAFFIPGVIILTAKYVVAQ